MDVLQVPLHKLILMLAHTVDLVGQDDYLHGRRVGLIAAQLSRQLGASRDQQQEAYYAGLLHDCGVSSNRMHRQLISAIEWSGAEQHCRIGHDLLQDFAPLARFAPIILNHHSRWTSLLEQDLPQETAALANLIFLADRIDVLCAPFYEDEILLAHVDSIRDVLLHYRSSIFAPQLIDAFLDASQAEAFWVPLMSPEIIQETQQEYVPGRDSLLSWPEIQQAAGIFAQIVDAKSPFTHRHSAGVAQLAGFLAKETGADPRHCEMIRVAGLLHDLGKLQVSDEILEAQRPLTHLEISQMRTHSYVTFRILHSLGHLGDIPLWAASHHEKLNGQGYPFRFGAMEISMEARMVAVADIYQALAQDRPYRPALSHPEILHALDTLSQQGQIDGDIVHLLHQHGTACHALAIAH